MNCNHSKGLQTRTIAALGILLFLVHTAAFGVLFSSFGVTVNKSVGLPEQKDIWIETSIFVPIKGRVLDLNLAINLNHTNFGDLDIMIEHPSGYSATISHYDRYNFIINKKCSGWVILDEQSLKTVNASPSLINSSYKPNSIEPLSSLNGLNSYGFWTIKLADTVYHDTGTINNLRLDITIDTLSAQTFFVIPEPASLLLCAVGIFIFKIRM